MLSLATVTLSPRSLAMSSSAGAIIRHGPHHSAQKSTRTGPSAPNTSLAKLWSVTVLVAMASETPSAKTLTAIWALRWRLSRHEFDEFRASGVEQRGAYLAFGEDHRQRFGIGRHLRAVRIRQFGVRFRHAPGLEIDHGKAPRFDQQAIDRASDHPAIGQGRGQRSLAEGTRPE